MVIVLHFLVESNKYLSLYIKLGYKKVYFNIKKMTHIMFKVIFSLGLIAWSEPKSDSTYSTPYIIWF